MTRVKVSSIRPPYQTRVAQTIREKGNLSKNGKFIEYISKGSFNDQGNEKMKNTEQLRSFEKPKKSNYKP